jgi:membrane-associated phospholipid phosphatase
VKDLYINDPRERTVPYLYAAMGFVFWSYLLLKILHAPLALSCVAVGATAAIGIVTLINRRWKISAHLAGLGGLIGGIFSYCLSIGAIPTWGTLFLWLALSLALMVARLYLDAHTPAQVCAGWLLGLACTFLPYCLLYYVG